MDSLTRFFRFAIRFFTFIQDNFAFISFMTFI